MQTNKPSRSSIELADDGFTQSERFMRAARDLECDDDPHRFAERVRMLMQPSSALQPSKGSTPARAKG